MASTILEVYKETTNKIIILAYRKIVFLTTVLDCPSISNTSKQTQLIHQNLEGLDIVVHRNDLHLPSFLIFYIYRHRLLQQINKAASFRDFHKDCIPNAVNLSDTVPVPFKQPADSFFDFNFVGPAETVEFAYVYEFAHCAVGL